MYKIFFNLVFQRMDPERAHYLAFRWIRLAVRVPVLRTFVAAALAPRHKELRTEAFGLRMHGPSGSPPASTRTRSRSTACRCSASITSRSAP